MISLQTHKGTVIEIPTVTVVITTFNHARYLDQAIKSVLKQISPASEIIVVDDGSTDNPSEVTSKYANINLIRQINQGLAAARNTGLMHAENQKVIFLDADDLLQENALSTGIACFSEHPEAGFVYGGFRRVSEEGQPISPDILPDQRADCLSLLMIQNHIGMHAAVMFDCAKLRAVGGYDNKLKRCEDYDVYFRMCNSYSSASHRHVVAEYRIHDDNMSSNPREMLKWALLVHQKHRPLESSILFTPWTQGQQFWKAYYCGEALNLALKFFKARKFSRCVKSIGNAIMISPFHTFKRTCKFVVKSLPGPIARQIYVGFGKPPPPGTVRLGDIGRQVPIDGNFGFARGQPVDRYYIEAFLEKNARFIRGRALEIGDAAYCRRYGGNQIKTQDVLNINEGTAGTTIVGDLAIKGTLPASTFDSIVLTQTLHLIFDLQTAVGAIFDALKPGGVALITIPGISPVDRGDWKNCWYWSMTQYATQRLFEPVFGAAHVETVVYGNVYAATLFLQGIAAEEADAKKLDHVDEAYPVIVALKVTRPDV